MFSHPHFIVKPVRFVRGHRESTDTEQFGIHADALGSVVDMYSIPSLNNLCHVSELEELTLAH